MVTPRISGKAHNKTILQRLQASQKPLPGGWKVTLSWDYDAAEDPDPPPLVFTATRRIRPPKTGVRLALIYGIRFPRAPQWNVQINTDDYEETDTPISADAPEVLAELAAMAAVVQQMKALHYPASAAPLSVPLPPRKKR